MYALPKKKLSSGQAVLIVLLGMAVTLTIVLSIVSRSITDISLSTTDEESARAFSAAEAGIENMIIGAVGTGTTTAIGESSYVTASSDFGLDTSGFNFMDQYSAGETATVWFVGHDSDNNLSCTGVDCFTGTNLQICWGNDGASSVDEETPAIEVTTYYDTTTGWQTSDYSGVRVARSAIDPYGSRPGDNGFSPSVSSGSGTNCTIGSVSYPFYSGNITLPSSSRLLFARIKFLYNATTPHALGVKSSNGTFPSQGKIFSSTGTSGSSVRKVEVVDLYRSPLGIFEAGLFSVGDLKKNN